MKQSILPVVAITVALLIAACGGKGPLPPADKTPPQVTSTIPANGTVDVPVNLSAGITLVFSKTMDASTISDQTISLAHGQNNVPGSVMYTESAGVPTAVFIPASTLNPSTLYIVTVDARVQDRSGISAGAPYTCSFITGDVRDTIPPNIVTTTPRNGDSSVMQNAALSVSFSEPVDQQTISFLLSSGSATIPCTMTYIGTTAIFTPPAALAYGTSYTATVRAGVKDLAGNAMSNSYIWSFVTGTAPDTTPPVITATSPAAGATDVAINIAPSATFSEPVNQQTISFLLSSGSGTIPCTMSYSGTTAIFKPLVALAYSTSYRVTVRSGVKDLAGNSMSDTYVWSFVTSAAPDTTPPVITATSPAAGATGVDINIAPSATFNEPVDEKTISFLLSSGSAIIPCTMSYSGTTAIFTPLTPLADSTHYTATVSAGVKDLAGNAMTKDYSWSFGTGAASDTTPPVVTATSPADGADNVATSITPDVTFNEPVDQQTISFLLSSEGTAIPCMMIYNGTTASFIPFTHLAYRTSYTATVSAGVKDLAGNAMTTDYVWTFRTKKK